MTRDPNRQSDGLLTVDGGVDSGNAPDLLEKNQLAWAVNTSIRGGWATCRPGWLKCTLDWQGEDDSEAAFMDSLFQVAGTYVSDTGAGYLMASIGGRQFSLALSSEQTLTAQEITIAGDRNSSKLDQAWCCQAENFWLLQNNQEPCFIWNGASSTRAIPGQIPTGKQITYYKGRVWVAKDRSYVAGDSVWGPFGTTSISRSSILSFQENTFLYEGGAFAVPAEFGNITALKPIGSINTALGQGELIVYTANGVFATNPPVDRSAWSQTKELVQRIIQLKYGALFPPVDVNEDHYYRSLDGIRSLVYAVRNSGQPGNTPISHEMERALVNDSSAFLRFGSGALFDNRLFFTCAPQVSEGHGTYHRALAVMELEMMSSLRGKQPPAWCGIWTGLRILQIVSLTHFGSERCFMFALNSDNEIEVWEMTNEARFDEGDRRIRWSMETRLMDFGGKFDRHNLFSADTFVDQIAGTVDFDVDWRPDGQPCWFDWDSWQECGKYKLCPDENPFGDCPTLPNYQEQYRPNHQLLQPPDTMVPILNQLAREGFEHQLRITIDGHARFKQLRVNAYIVQQPPYGEQL